MSCFFHKPARGRELERYRVDEMEQADSTTRHCITWPALLYFTLLYSTLSCLAWLDSFGVRHACSGQHAIRLGLNPIDWLVHREVRGNQSNESVRILRDGKMSKTTCHPSVFAFFPSCLDWRHHSQHDDHCFLFLFFLAFSFSFSLFKQACQIIVRNENLSSRSTSRKPQMIWSVLPNKNMSDVMHYLRHCSVSSHALMLTVWLFLSLSFPMARVYRL